MKYTVLHMLGHMAYVYNAMSFESFLRLCHILAVPLGPHFLVYLYTVQNALLITEFACSSRHSRVSGLVVEYVPATDETRVRFPADALEIFCPFAERAKFSGHKCTMQDV